GDGARRRCDLRLLDERPELPAARTFAEPAARGVPALGTGEDGRRSLRHGTSLRPGPDTLCDDSSPERPADDPTLMLRGPKAASPSDRACVRKRRPGRPV